MYSGPGAVIALVIVVLAALLWLGWFVFAHFRPVEADADDHAARIRFRHQLAWVHHHLVLFLLIVGLFSLAIPPAAYQLGYTNGTHDAQYFASHYSNLGSSEPPAHSSAPLPEPSNLGLVPQQRAIPQMYRYPRTGNQGTVGACAAFVTAWFASYAYRILHPLSWLKYSARCIYDQTSNLHHGGKDDGSNIYVNSQYFAQGTVPRSSRAPYGPNTLGLLQYAIDQPTLHACYVYGGAVKMLVTPHMLTGDTGNQGQAAVDRIRETIAGVNTVDGKGHPVSIGVRVTREFDNAAIQPNIVAPSGADYDRGGHDIGVIAYDDLHLFPDGSTGGVLVQNEWGRLWGVGGRAWLSYDYIRKLAYQITYITMSNVTAASPKTPPPPFLPNPAPGHTIPGASETAPATATTQWTVSYVPGHEGNRTINLASLINYWGTRYHVWPVALAATIYTESAGNVYAYRWQGGLDKSCGLMQVIVANIAHYEGIYDPFTACRWEYVPANSIMLGARMLHECDVAQGGAVTWPYLYVGYNAGCANPASFFYNPTGQAATNFYGNFLPNYNYALMHFAGKPPQKMFPVASWGRKSYKSHGKLTWAASNYRTSYGRYEKERYVKDRNKGYMIYTFQRAKLFCHFRTHKCNAQ